MNSMGTPACLLLLLLAAAVLLVSFRCDGAAAAVNGGHRFGREKVTNLHFYLHDTLSGKDPTAVLVARAAGAGAPSADHPVPFGSLYATDDVLTEGSERASKVVGSAQGLYVSSGKAKGMSLVMGIDFELTGYGGGAFNGSSFVVFSRNPVTAGDGREIAIVGGRGAFRMARGFALIRTIYLDTSNGDAILEYNVTLLHH